jgi:stress-induced morphogen
MPSAAQTSASQYQVNMHSAATTRFAIRSDRFEERVRIRFHIAVHSGLAGGIKNAHVHRLHVETIPQ